SEPQVIDRNRHPAPLLRRPWHDLDGEWEYSTDPAADPCRVSWNEKINVPFSPGTPASGRPLPADARRFWYRRTFEHGPAAHGRRLLLHFSAVDRAATVWVNGSVAGSHMGGYTPFCFDVTDLVGEDRASALIEVAVRADDPRVDDDAPRGKQDWRSEPHSIWYPRTCGIWRSVWCEEVGSAYLSDVHWSADVAAMSLNLTARVEAAPPGARLEAEVRHGERVVGFGAGAVQGGQVELRIPVGDGGIDDRTSMLWWPRRPTLIDAELVLRTAGGEVLDRAQSYAALREVEVRDGRFCINGRPTFLRMVLDQGYWPDTGATPPDGDALRRDLQLARSLGFNGVRKHQKTEDARYFAHADEMGMMVWVEMPSAYRPGAVSAVNLIREWTGVVMAHRSHPSVVAWVPLNESWGVFGLAQDRQRRATATALAAVSTALDGTRPVSVNDGWETSGGEIVGVHDYGQDPSIIARRYADAGSLERLVGGTGPSDRRIDLDGRGPEGRAVFLSEFGGVALADGGEGTWGYTTADSPDDLLDRYRKQWAAVHESTALAGACWTQLTDTYQEANGLLGADRRPKVDPHLLSEATRGRWRS
ncbi:MAG TPA: glycoside hydrolase family 2 TIM barrel-domain containing protein, partial [Acidimicrobiales bacterium]|nr:glycoside hydrolase family 2 TIM barrel-domain containing protein [Acidimicrobiales bacterium]